MGKFRQISTELSARDTPMFSFPDLSILQGILIKLGTCIDKMEIWFGISNGQISMSDRVICQRHDGGVLYVNVLLQIYIFCVYFLQKKIGK